VRHTGFVATQPDPYRTLGLAPGATADEVRRAYRRLAKANHPDAAGEKNLPRFLAIQAAYEALAGSNGTRRPGARPATPQPTARETWRADPGRARTTRQGRPAGPEPSATGKRRRPPSEEPRRPAAGRKRSSNTATPGSTTYDTAEDEPFEPEWSGGTWYGASSGTYWTINPKEYADPRKHGPEYQRRARRRAGATGPPQDADSVDAANDAPDETVAGPAAPSGPPTDAWDGWPDEVPGDRANATDTSGTATPAAGDAGGAGFFAAGGLFSIVGLRGGFPARVGLALLGWPPIGVAISTIVGEVTGCGRFAASCVEVFGVGTWLAQLAIIAVLLALPAVATLSAVGTLAVLAASVPTAVVLSASGGSREPAVSAAILGTVLAVAYLAGVVFAIARRSRFGRVP
jgi:DnaJ domain